MRQGQNLFPLAGITAVCSITCHEPRLEWKYWRMIGGLLGIRRQLFPVRSLLMIEPAFCALHDLAGSNVKRISKRGEGL